MAQVVQVAEVAERVIGETLVTLWKEKDYIERHECSNLKKWPPAGYRVASCRELLSELMKGWRTSWCHGGIMVEYYCDVHRQIGVKGGKMLSSHP